MTRKLRVQYAGAIYHVMSQGDRRELIFKDDKDDLGQEWKKSRRGWCLGRGSFRLILLERMEGQVKEHHFEPERRESAEELGLRIIAEGLAKAGWKAGKLEKRRKSDPVKVELALRLRQETTLPLKWIAEHLHMGTWDYLSRLLYKARKEQDHEVRNLMVQTPMQK
jgi:hypothetical protein